MILHPSLAVFQVTGADASTFLQAQLAADMSKLAADHYSFSAYCNPKGQVIALLLVCHTEQGFFIATHRSLTQTVLGTLQKYVLRSKVVFNTRPGMYVCVQTKERSDSGTDAKEGASLFRWCHASNRDRPAKIDQIHYGILQLPEDGETIEALKSGEQESPERVHHRELMAGICWLESVTSERFIPQMLGYEKLGAVSFNKGCYPGQEIIARTRYLGKLKRHPVLIETAADYPLMQAGTVCQLVTETDTDSSDAHTLPQGEDQRDAVVVDSVSGNQGQGLMQLVAAVSPGEKVRSIVFDGATRPVDRHYSP